MTDPFDLDTMLAQQRLKSAMEYQPNAPKGGMVGDVFVGAHPMQMLSEALRGYTAGQDKQAAMQELKNIGQQRQTQTADALRRFGELSKGTAAFEAAGPAPQGQEQSGGYVVPGQKPDLMAAYSSLMNTQDPTLRQAGMKGIIEAPQMQQEAMLKREKMLQDAQLARERLQDRQDARMMAMSNRPEKMVTVLGPNGESLSMPQSQAQAGGMELYNPVRAKQIQTEQGKKVGQTGLSDTLDTLSAQYNKLNQNMGIPSKENRVLSNLGAAASSTGIGNFAGRMLGTENAEARDLIAQTRPLLLADIKKATGMTASEMNSNAELQMWLSVATDPSKGFDANIEAIRNLENKFGLGRGKGEKTNPFLNKKPAAGGGNIDSLLDKYK